MHENDCYFILRPDPDSGLSVYEKSRIGYPEPDFGYPADFQPDNRFLKEYFYLFFRRKR